MSISTPAPQTDRIARGIAFVLLSAVVFAPLVQATSKFLALEFPIMQILWVRAIGHTLWMLLLFCPRHGPGVFRSNRLGLQLTRSLLLFASSALWITAIPHVPLATGAAIMFTAPIFVAVLSVPLLGERVGTGQFIAVLVGFGGVLAIIRPGANEATPGLLLLGAAAAFGIYQIVTRKLARHDSSATSAVYTMIATVVCTSFVVPFNYRIPSLDDWQFLLGFAAVGLLGGFRHLFVVKAMEYAPASIISPF